MKRLFIIIRGSLAAKYGVGTYVQQLIHCFDQSEWKILVVEVFPIAREFIEEEKEGIFYYHIPFKANTEQTGFKDFRESYQLSIFYFLKDQVLPGDKVYCHFNFVYEYELARLFKKELHAKVILTLHYTDWSFDLLGDREWLLRILQNPVKKEDQRVVKCFEAEKKFMLDCCDRVIAIARHSYETLLTVYGIPESKLVYISNALKDEFIERSTEEKSFLRKKYGFSETEKLIIFAGRFNLVKGINELLEAFKLIGEDLPDCRLILAGDEGILNCFKIAAPCWSKIVFTGFISKEQLYELYSIANVGVVPSIHEEFGYVAVEMMMNNLPLIASDSTGLREVTAQGRYAKLIDMHKPDNRIEEIRQALLDWFIKENNLKPGRERFKEEYDLEVLERRIKLLYRDI